LAVDPSSIRTGGSILGDKTRMAELSNNNNAYVRPSPNRGTLGGVTRTTSEAIVICEAAGYNIVLIETVGVGQSEIAVEDMVDCFTLLVPPAGGDEIQGIKKGIVELADILIVNKADGDLIPVATRAEAEYSSALKLLRPKSENWTPKVLMCSSKTNTKIDIVWETMVKFKDIMQKKSEYQLKRAQQRKSWMWKMVKQELIDAFQNHPRTKQLIPFIEKEVLAGLISPTKAADRLLSEFLKTNSSNNHKK